MVFFCPLCEPFAPSVFDGPEVLTHKLSVKKAISPRQVDIHSYYFNSKRFF